MKRCDPRAWRRLNRYLDEVVTGDGTDTTGIDAALIAAVHTVHELAEAPVREPHWFHSQMDPYPSEPSVMTAPCPNDRVAKSRPSLLRSRGVTAAATVALLLLTAAGMLVAFRPEAFPTGSGADSAVYIVTNDGTTFTRLDTVTLIATTDVATVEPMSSDVNDGVVSEWYASVDGLRLIRMEATYSFAPILSPTTQFVVYDSMDGQVISAWTPASAPGAPLQLSSDGRRLAFKTGGSYSSEQPGPSTDQEPIWWVYDTTTGRLLSTIQADQLDPSGTGNDFALAPNGQRLYRIESSVESQFPGPWPVDLVVNDVTTGAEIGRVALPEVLAGRWPSRETMTTDTDACGFIGADGTPITGQTRVLLKDHLLIPAIAVSPDSRTVIVVDGDGAAMTAVDAQSLLVRNRLPIIPSKASPIAQTFLPAECSTQIGQSRVATFSPDGEILLVSGRDMDSPIIEPLPLQSVDIITGHVIGEQSADGQSFYLEPPPAFDTGKSLFVIAYSELHRPSEAVPDSRVYRFESAALTVGSVADVPLAQLIVLQHPFPPLGDVQEASATASADLE